MIAVTMTVTVMSVGNVGVTVGDRFVLMPMGVRLTWIDAVGVVVSVMFVMDVAMFVGQRLVRVSVTVTVGQQQRSSYSHEHQGSHRASTQVVAEHDDRDDHAGEGRSGEQRGLARCTQ